jgi:hypothetical protein
MSDTAAIPFPPRSNDVDEVEETEEEIEETDDTEEVEETEEVDDEEETEAVTKPKKSSKQVKAKAKAKKGKPVKAKKKAKESFSAELAPGSIEIPETAGGTDPLRLELAEKACKEGWQNCATLAAPLRCSSITARHYLYKAARLPGAQVQFRMSGKRGVPSLHVFIPAKKSKK